MKTPSGRDAKFDLADRLRETAEGLVDLVTAQLRLMRLELLADARALGSQLLKLAVFAGLLAFAYALLLGLVVVAIARWLGLPVALALVGTIHLGIGLAGALRTLGAMRQVRLFDRSREIMTKGAERAATDGTSPQIPPPPLTPGGTPER